MKHFVSFLLFFILFCGLCVCAQEGIIASEDIAMGVLCSPNKKMCAVGKTSLTSNGQPLYVADGVVCTLISIYVLMDIRHCVHQKPY